MIRDLFPTYPIRPPPPFPFKSLNHHITDTIQLTVSVCIFFQVGVEIRDELQLIEPSDIRHDISREVSKTRRMIDTVLDLGAILFGTDIFPHSTNFAYLYVDTIFNLSFPNNQQIIV